MVEKLARYRYQPVDLSLQDGGSFSSYEELRQNNADAELAESDIFPRVVVDPFNPHYILMQVLRSTGWEINFLEDGPNYKGVSPGQELTVVSEDPRAIIGFRQVTLDCLENPAFKALSNAYNGYPRVNVKGTSWDEITQRKVRAFAFDQQAKSYEEKKAEAFRRKAEKCRKGASSLTEEEMKILTEKAIAPIVDKHHIPKKAA